MCLPRKRLSVERAKGRCNCSLVKCRFVGGHLGLMTISSGPLYLQVVKEKERKVRIKTIECTKCLEDVKKEKRVEEKEGRL